MAARAVFDTVELLEQILLELPMLDIFIAQRVSRHWKAVIADSCRIQTALFLASVADIARVPYTPPPSLRYHRISAHQMWLGFPDEEVWGQMRDLNVQYFDEDTYTTNPVVYRIMSQPARYLTDTSMPSPSWKNWPSCSLTTLTK